MIRVLLVEDHSSFREALAAMIEREPDFSVVGQAGTLAEARPMLGGVDVVVVNLHLPDGDGTELVRELRAANPDAVGLVLTGSEDRVVHARAVEAGAAGVLHKSSPIREIVAAMRRLHTGEMLLSRAELVEMLSLAREQRERERDAQRALESLTPREREVLQALPHGASDKEIAERLGISERTVRTHVLNILGKLGVNSRLEALVFAVRHGAVRLH